MTELLPPNASQLERDLDASIGQALDIPVRLADVWDPFNCPLGILPWLAWAFSVDLWDENWSVEARRNTTAASLAFHKRKGSPGSMRDALRAAGYGEVEIIERLDIRRRDGTILRDGSHFYSESEHWAWYSIVLLRPVSIAQAAQVREILSRAQPERCKLHELRYDQALNLRDATILRDGTFTRGVVDGQSA